VTLSLPTVGKEVDVTSLHHSSQGTGWVPHGTGAVPQGTGLIPQGTGSAPQGNVSAPQPTGSATQGTGTPTQATGSAPQGTGTPTQATGSAPQGPSSQTLQSPGPNLPSQPRPFPPGAHSSHGPPKHLTPPHVSTAARSEPGLDAVPPTGTAEGGGTSGPKGRVGEPGKGEDGARLGEHGGAEGAAESARGPLGGAFHRVADAGETAESLATQGPKGTGGTTGPGDPGQAPELGRLEDLVPGGPSRGGGSKYTVLYHTWSGSLALKYKVLYGTRSGVLALRYKVLYSIWSALLVTKYQVLHGTFSTKCYIGSSVISWSPEPGHFCVEGRKGAHQRLCG
jgi:hypothetical protein